MRTGTPKEVSGGTSSTSCSPASPCLWVSAMSGGFLISATRMEEVVRKLPRIQLVELLMFARLLPDRLLHCDDILWDSNLLPRGGHDLYISQIILALHII